MGIRQTGVPIGGILSATIWPIVALAQGWRAAYLLGGLAALLSAALIFGGYLTRLARATPRTSHRLRSAPCSATRGSAGWR